MKKTQTAKKKSAVAQLLEKQIKEPISLTYGEGEGEFVIKVRPAISFKERVSLINEVVGMVFSFDGDTVQKYYPEYREIATRYAVVQHYTDFKLPIKIDELWLVLSQTTIYDDVVNAVGHKELEDIFRAIEEDVCAKREYLVHKTDVSSLLKKLGDAVANVGENFTKEDLTAALSVLKNIPNFTDKEIVKGILDAHEDNNETT